MPRRTHPQPRRKHDRGHTRFYRDLVIRRNWGQAKARYGHLPRSLHPDDARRQPEHADAFWPFTLPRNAFARNPFNLCSCWMCSMRPSARRIQRRRETRSWQADAAEQLAAREPEVDESLSVRWSVARRHPRVY